MVRNLTRCLKTLRPPAVTLSTSYGEDENANHKMGSRQLCACVLLGRIASRQRYRAGYASALRVQGNDNGGPCQSSFPTSSGSSSCSTAFDRYRCALCNKYPFSRVTPGSLTSASLRVFHKRSFMQGWRKFSFSGFSVFQKPIALWGSL